ncbi:AGC kinase, putative [Eimeria brunetti]|uniref:AGC kinase, putative n=1 Tax=Eimeria brunetti TaxID=51314 RepID=U6LIW7_9EIME|nr:AGC kinase, putative [Eimeria brunetti]
MGADTRELLQQQQQPVPSHQQRQQIPSSQPQKQPCPLDGQHQQQQQPRPNRRANRNYLQQRHQQAQQDQPHHQQQQFLQQPKTRNRANPQRRPRQQQQQQQRQALVPAPWGPHAAYPPSAERLGGRAGRAARLTPHGPHSGAPQPWGTPLPFEAPPTAATQPAAASLPPVQQCMYPQGPPQHQQRGQHPPQQHVQQQQQHLQQQQRVQQHMQQRPTPLVPLPPHYLHSLSDYPLFSIMSIPTRSPFAGAPHPDSSGSSSSSSPLPPGDACNTQTLVAKADRVDFPAAPTTAATETAVAKENTAVAAGAATPAFSFAAPAEAAATHTPANDGLRSVEAARYAAAPLQQQQSWQHLPHPYWQPWQLHQQQWHQQLQQQQLQQQQWQQWHQWHQWQQQWQQWQRMTCALAAPVDLHAYAYLPAQQLQRQQRQLQQQQHQYLGMLQQWHDWGLQRPAGMNKSNQRAPRRGLQQQHHQQHHQQQQHQAVSAPHCSSGLGPRRGLQRQWQQVALPVAAAAADCMPHITSGSSGAAAAVAAAAAAAAATAAYPWPLHALATGAPVCEPTGTRISRSPGRSVVAAPAYSYAVTAHGPLPNPSPQAPPQQYQPPPQQYQPPSQQHQPPPQQHQSRTQQHQPSLPQQQQHQPQREQQGHWEAHGRCNPWNSSSRSGRETPCLPRSAQEERQNGSAQQLAEAPLRGCRRRATKSTPPVAPAAPSCGSGGSGRRQALSSNNTADTELTKSVAATAHDGGKGGTCNCSSGAPQSSRSSSSRSRTRRKSSGGTSNTRRTAEEGDSETKNMAYLAPQVEAKKVGLGDFMMLHVIGRGLYGKVMLARFEQDGQLYALKILLKEFVLCSSQVEHTLTERVVLEAFPHPFLVQMHFAFQTPKRLFFVLEYCPGGELLFHLQKAKKFTEERSRFYAAELLVALGHLHKHNVIHRDLKLENVLLGTDGHIRLADFGFSKICIPHNKTARSVCGTPEYMAPEILCETGYGKEVDWWSLGALLYEMLTGLPPFYTGNRQTLPTNILRGRLEFPSDLSPAAVDLLKNLLRRDANERLGAGPQDAEEIMRHPFFESVNWDLLVAKKIEPPFKPNLRSNEDAKYFPANFRRERVLSDGSEGPNTAFRTATSRGSSTRMQRSRKPSVGSAGKSSRRAAPVTGAADPGGGSNCSATKGTPGHLEDAGTEAHPNACNSHFSHNTQPAEDDEGEAHFKGFTYDERLQGTWGKAATSQDDPYNF